MRKAAKGDGEGDGLVRLAVDNGVAPLLYRHLEKSPDVRRDLLGTLWGAYHANVLWNRDALAEIACILDVLRSAGVDAIPLKGAVGALSLLGDEGLYAGSDVDLLVRRERLEEAVRLLKAWGYADRHVDLADSLAVSYHHCLQKGTFRVEVHWNLVQLPFAAAPDLWWEDATPYATSAGAPWALSAEKYLLYLIYRLYSHGFAPLRLFVLPAEIANGRAGHVDWDRLMTLSRRCRMYRVSCFALAFMKDRLGVEVPEEIARPGREKRILHEMIARALTGGEPIRKLTRMRLYSMFDSRFDVVRKVLRMIFPPMAEIRFRYGMKGWGWKLSVFYLLNPALMLMNLEKRKKFIGRFVGEGEK